MNSARIQRDIAEASATGDRGFSYSMPVSVSVSVSVFVAVVVSVIIAAPVYGTGRGVSIWPKVRSGAGDDPFAMGRATGMALGLGHAHPRAEQRAGQVAEQHLHIGADRAAGSLDLG